MKAKATDPEDIKAQIDAVSGAGSIVLVLVGCCAHVT